MLIDLDRGEPVPAGGARGRTRLWVVGVVCLLVGALVGGLLTDRWHTSAVSVVALADSGGVSDSAGPSLSVGSRVTAVSLASHARIVNAGPAAVDVIGVSADRPGVTLRDTGNRQRLEPGATLTLAVDVQVECVARGRLHAVDAAVTVETRGGERREVAVRLGGSAWVQQVEDVCAAPASWSDGLN